MRADMRVGVVAVLGVVFSPAGWCAGAGKSYSPDAGRSYPVDVYWGNTTVTGTFGNLHRVVVFKDAAATVTKLPPSESVRSLS